MSLSIKYEHLIVKQNFYFEFHNFIFVRLFVSAYPLAILSCKDLIRHATVFFVVQKLILLLHLLILLLYLFGLSTLGPTSKLFFCEFRLKA